MAKAASKRRARVQEQAYEDASGVVVPIRAKRAKGKRALATQTFTEGRTCGAPLVPKTKAQANYKQAIESHTVTIGVGPAGTGKSYVATKIAAKMLEEKEISRIIVTRPAIGVEDEDLGALPGELDAKVQPWFQPILDILNQHFGTSHVECLIKSKKILFVPMAHLRGLSLNSCFIILDECQNATPKKVLTLLTRIGENSKCVLDGDPEQVDIHGESGLMDAVRRLKDVPDIAVVTFSDADIVRHRLIADIMKAYRKSAPDA